MFCFISSPPGVLHTYPWGSESLGSTQVPRFSSLAPWTARRSGDSETHKDPSGENKARLCVTGALCMSMWLRPLTFTCWRMVFRVLYSWSGSFSSFLKHREHKQVDSDERRDKPTDEKGPTAKLESLSVESHVPFAHRLPASFTCLYEETMNQCHLSHFKLNVRYCVRKIYGALSSQLPKSNIRMPGMLSMGICRTPSLKQESPG